MVDLTSQLNTIYMKDMKWRKLNKLSTTEKVSKEQSAILSYRKNYCKLYYNFVENYEKKINILNIL